MNKDNTREIYADIIDLPHHQSESRPQISLYDRVAQFSPFAALSGYDDMVREEARLTDQRRKMSETELDILNQKLSLIEDLVKDKTPPEITVVYFVPDPLKAGGRYATMTGTVKRIDPVERSIIFYAPNMISNGQAIYIDEISEIHGRSIDYVEDSLGRP